MPYKTDYDPMDKIWQMASSCSCECSHCCKCKHDREKIDRYFEEISLIYPRLEDILTIFYHEKWTPKKAQQFIGEVIAISDCSLPMQGIKQLLLAMTKRQFEACKGNHFPEEHECWQDEMDWWTKLGELIEDAY